MDLKEKRMVIIFAMFFIASLVVTLLFNTGDVTGEAIKEFNSTKEKSSYCEQFCDEEINKPNPVYGNWIGCHEECMKN